MTQYCKVYDLKGPITEADLDWMYNSGIDIQCERPYDSDDSGWCDASTGVEVLTASHKFTAFVKSEKEDTWLQLYWEHRAVYKVEIQRATAKYEDAN